jgi:hypothetical protein
MAQLTTETKAELEAKHGKVLVLEVDIEEETYTAAFRGANPAEWQRFLDETHDKERVSRATRALVVSCAVWPPEAEFGAMLKEKPGLVQSFGNELTDFCGSRRATVRKK